MSRLALEFGGRPGSWTKDEKPEMKPGDSRNLADTVSQVEGRIPEIAEPLHEGASPLTAVRSENGYVPPRDEIESELVRIWQDILELPKIGIRDDFFELGGHSIIAVQLMVAIEQKYHKRFELSLLFSQPTIEALAQELRAAREISAINIVPMHPEGNRTPLFCIHCATGHVLRYRKLTALLDPDVPVYGLRAPDMREFKTLPTVEELAEIYLADIRQVQPTGPYQVCGFSFGGIVAFEVARRLRNIGEAVSFLGLLDTFNPAHYRSMPFLMSLRFRSIYLSDRLTQFAHRFFHGEWKELFAQLQDHVLWRVREVIWSLRRKKPSVPDQSARKEIQDVVVMFANIGWEFSPKKYPGRIFLFRAAKRRAEFAEDKGLGWDDIAEEGVQVCNIPGDHFTILEGADVLDLARSLNSYLAPNR
jgi:thioesterase domain-containing protein/acyl carrier protein